MKLRYVAERLRDNRGMTLVELMFAAGIMALALSFLFGALVTLSMAGSLTEDRGVAVTHLATVMEELKGLEFKNMMQYVPPTFTNLGVVETVTLRAYYDDGTAVALPVDPTTLATPLPNPVRVECTLTWTGVRGRVMTQSASQLFYR